MRPLRRPPEEARTRWVGLQKTVAAKADIAERIAKGDTLKSEDFDNAWTEGQWTQALADAQDGLCAWCTVRPLAGGHTGAIDHIRPRSAVTRNVAEDGLEVGQRGLVRDRRLLPTKVLRPGYHWRAYDPDNLAFSCERCNTGWKRTLWPVRPWRDSTSWRAPDPNTPEEELVLDPFEQTFNPNDHFLFGPFGAMLHRDNDERAEATIMTFELDRPSLCGERATRQRDLDTDLRAIRRDLCDGTLNSDQEGLLVRVAERCDWSTPHAAFYRVALKHTLNKLDIPWVRLRAEWDQRNLAADVPDLADDSWVE